jgi:hypothetical protein
MKARVYALHTRLPNQSLGMPTRAIATSDDAIIKTASVVIASDVLGMSHTMEVPVGVLGGSPEIGDEFELLFGHNVKE